MTSKTMTLLKFATLMVLSAIVLCSILYGLLRNVIFSEDNAKKDPMPRHDETIVNERIIPKDTSVFVGNYTSKDANVSIRDSLVNIGMTLLGTPYADGACGADGFDCSGFVFYVFRYNKIKVPRSSSEFENFGKEIPIDKARKGDILVFMSPTRPVIGHVGIVTDPKGMETEFIHSTSGSEMKVVISSLKQEGYKKRFVKAVDVLGD